MDRNGTPIWRLHTKLYKGAWSTRQITQKLWATVTWDLEKLFRYLSFNISFSSFLPLDGFQFFFFVAWQWKRSITFSLKLLQFLSTIKFASTKSISVDNIFLSLSQQASCGHSIFFPILQFKIVYVFESSDYRKNMRGCSLTNADDGKAAFVKAKWKGSWWINIRFLVL